jgi:hypothetical protein
MENNNARAENKQTEPNTQQENNIKDGIATIPIIKNNKTRNTRKEILNPSS